MALAQLHLARQEALRTCGEKHANLSTRCQRWDGCLGASTYCAQLSRSVSDVQDETADRVFARQVLFNATCVAPPQHIHLT